jgi:hypothetical protein
MAPKGDLAEAQELELKAHLISHTDWSFPQGTRRLKIRPDIATCG